MNLDLKCPSCEMLAQDLRSANHVLEPPKLDDLWLCGSCATVCKVTLTGLTVLTQSELSSLHPDERADLDFAQRAIKRNLRNS